MSTSLETIQAEVLRLSPSDRSRLLERLIVSLDADAEVEAEWDAVADAREAEITSGIVTTVPLEEAMARLETRFKGLRFPYTLRPRMTLKKPPSSTKEPGL